MWLGLGIRITNWWRQVSANGPFNNHATLLDGLVSYWRLDEALGVRYDSVVSSANDLTDNNTVTSAAGVRDSAAVFVAANSEYLSRANASAANLRFGGDFAFSLWVKPTDHASPYMFVTKDYDVVRGYAVYVNTSQQVVVQIPKVGGLDIAVVSTDTLTDGAWNHIVAEYDSVGLLGKVTVNGGTVKTLASSGPPVESTAEFDIGREAYPGFPFYANAAIDEVGAWSRVLTAQERTDLWNSGSGLFY